MAKKYYSTLKIQQEWVKAYCKDNKPTNDLLWFNRAKDGLNIVYHGVAIYYLPQWELAINIYDEKDEFKGGSKILEDMAEFDNALTFNRIEVKDKRELVYFDGADGSKHCLDKKFLDLVNIEIPEWRFYCKDSKQNIISIVNDMGEIIAGIMEVRA